MPVFAINVVSACMRRTSCNQSNVKEKGVADNALSYDSANHY